MTVSKTGTGTGTETRTVPGTPQLYISPASVGISAHPAFIVEFCDNITCTEVNGTLQNARNLAVTFHIVNNSNPALSLDDLVLHATITQRPVGMSGDFAIPVAGSTFSNPLINFIGDRNFPIGVPIVGTFVSCEYCCPANMSISFYVTGPGVASNTISTSYADTGVSCLFSTEQV